MNTSKTNQGNLLLTKFALLAVVFVDAVGQGLIFPIVNTLMMEPSVGFLPVNTPQATRHFDYGLVIGVFFLSWFLGAVYISKISDSIGRKKGIMICLSGALVGYLLTILSLQTNSLWLMVLGRAVTGFTAGNQPIAQAAMIDLSHDDAERTRNMGYIVSGFSLGLVGGPIIGGVLSDKSLLGNFASLSLPFYVAIGVILLTMGLILFFFQDARQDRAPLRIKPQDIVLLLWQITERPVVLRISLVYFWFMFVSNSFIIFLDNYLSSRFQVGTLGASGAMMVFGAALAFSGAYLVSIAGERFTKRLIVVTALITEAVLIALFILTSSVIFAFLLVFPFGIVFAIAYPTLLSIYSASVDNTEQGWVMGVSTALFTLGAGLTSFMGGDLMGLGIRDPFYIAIGSAILALGLIATVWQTSSIRRITG